MRALVIAAIFAATPVDGPGRRAGRVPVRSALRRLPWPGLQGDGPMAEVLMVPPPDLTRIAERYDGFPAWASRGRSTGAIRWSATAATCRFSARIFGEMSEIMRTVPRRF
jgi:hypothetical protein